MNAKQLIAAAAVLAASSSVFAQMPDGVGASPYYPEQPFMSSKARAEVRAELLPAYRQGMMPQGAQTEYATLQPFTSRRTREEVRREAAEAYRHRTYDVDHAVNG